MRQDTRTPEADESLLTGARSSRSPLEDLAESGALSHGEPAAPEDAIAGGSTDGRTTGGSDGASSGWVGRRDFVKTVTTAALGTGLAASGLERGRAAPDELPIGQHMHRGHQDVIFLGIYFEDNAPPGPIEAYETAMFDPDADLGYDDYTVQEYFDIVSDGRFSIGPGPAGLVGWYQTSQPSDDFNLGDAVREALDAAIADGFDITAYDQENPTQIVALTFMGGGGGGVAWVGNTIERQGVLIRGFCQAPARASAAEQDINYTCHEYLHLHGLTDFYQAPGTGNMGIMGAGPLVNMIPWSKVNVDLDQTPGPTGWDETTAIHPTDQAGILPPQSIENQFYTVVGESNPAGDDPDFHKHYYLAYADGTGVDAPLDRSQRGLVVWHHYQSMGVEWGAENLQFDTPPANGSTFQATNSALDASLIDTDIVLDTVSTDYGTLQFNDPPHRSASAGSTSVYAVDVDTTHPDWMPDLSHRESQNHGDVIYTDDVLDARVSWADDGDDVTLRLFDPAGAEHAVSDDFATSFAVVRSDALTGQATFDGGWKLVEETSGSDTVEYFRATNYPTYELATSAAVDGASLDDGELTLTVSLSFGDGDAYAYGDFGAPTTGQFEVEFDGSLLDDGDVSVTEVTQSTYELTAQVGPATDGDHSVAVTFVDEKVGVTNRTAAGTTTVAGSGGPPNDGPPPIGDNDGRPTDSDGDGLYDDVDGDGQLTHADVDAFYDHLEADGVQDNPDVFDFDGNGRIGFADVLDLLRRI
ncbi:hypothetical protein [Natrinema salaciae]|uniref:M6 family metalloprotease domain-containing protein n=1 Tax=Natrinema salaciae TaxID=1186196 RepID=A0A1H9IFP6_9EURY|nr:hypothetical protein [Natrinema salaciae]SEQ73389.1 M6 family metalloprotease domain-containing protein [Natrinema salaciae]